MKINKTWQGRVGASSSALRRYGTIALVVLAAISGLNTMWDFVFGRPTDVVTPARIIVNKSAVVSSFAEDYVTTWLTATSSTSKSLKQFVSVNSAELHLPTTPAVVIGSPTVVAVTAEGTAGKDDAAEVYSVVVGINQRPYDAAAPIRAMYRVPVLWSKFGPRATGLPYRVEGPGPGADLAQAYPTPLTPTDPAYKVVSGFITAYLTAAGGVEQYVTSDSMLTGLGGQYLALKDSNGKDLPLVTGVSAAAAVPTQPADGQIAQVLAAVTAVSSQYANVSMTYPLTLRGVGGNWSVAGINRAPLLSTDDDMVPVPANAQQSTN
ncbi:conjugal transfer protein [Mycolicibacterium sphagni]|uniref:Conjugal transfer protein n=1 Tax=Mycolicibacterium sphagni TaxID=1786 RepID=A0ABX2JXY6_9MYCO|nr:conjugal transfer protein [Mycolicibacterium sphagni]NTY62589.1 conjugal transfer protein [Mycolicibacterium sphagni]